MSSVSSQDGSKTISVLSPNSGPMSSQCKSNANLETPSLDWVKPPMHKGVWNTIRDDGLLTQVVRQADVVQGVVRDTFNVSMVSAAHSLISDANLFKNNQKCIRISPKCADEEEECAVYLSLQHILKLQLLPLGQIHTKKYGIINKYSGVKMRLEGSHPSRPPLQHDVYTVPDGYVYELPEIFTSARMVPSSKFGIPERQGIVHRELFHDHAIISHKNRLYALPAEHCEEVEEILAAHPQCVVPVEDGYRDDLNELFLREIPEGNKFKDLPYCYVPDKIAVDRLTDKFVYMQTPPRCVNCGQLWAALCCELCLQRQVQCPHMYCGEDCREKHLRRGHKDFHQSAQAENSVIEPDRRLCTVTREYGVRPDPNLPPEQQQQEAVPNRFMDI